LFTILPADIYHCSAISNTAAGFGLPEPMGDAYQPIGQSEPELSKYNEENVRRNSTTEPLVPFAIMSSQAPKKSRMPRGCLRFWDRYINNGWRGEILRIAIFSTLLWVANIAAYIVLFVKSNRKHGSGIFMDGLCADVERTNTLIHMALNIMTSLMLAASTSAMSSLCCPTRAEVDMAHAKARSLGVGGLSMRNFRFISRSRSILWILLWITSVPLHLL
jgi:hypothetical protein